MSDNSTKDDLLSNTQSQSGNDSTGIDTSSTASYRFNWSTLARYNPVSRLSPSAEERQQPNAINNNESDKPPALNGFHSDSNLPKLRDSANAKRQKLNPIEESPSSGSAAPSTRNLSVVSSDPTPTIDPQQNSSDSAPSSQPAPISAAPPSYRTVSWWYWATSSNPRNQSDANASDQTHDEASLRKLEAEAQPDDKHDRETSNNFASNDATSSHPKNNTNSYNTNTNSNDNFGEATVQETSAEVMGNNWSSWISPYIRITDMIGYVYAPGNGGTMTGAGQRPTATDSDQAPPPASIKGTESKSTDANNSAHAENSDTSNRADNSTNSPPAPASWWSWVWNGDGSQNDDDEGGDEEYNNASFNNTELFKSAKSAIENSRDQSHYAIRSSQSSNDFELAVSDTPTESQPVKYKTKKRPITPNEASENGMSQQQQQQQQQQLSQETGTVKKPPLGTNANGGTASSNSSIKSSKRQGTDYQSGDLSSELTSSKQELTDVVAPHFDKNFRYITLITKLRLMGEHWVYHKQSSERHLYRLPPKKIATRKHKRIKRVVIIGVHGFLPLKMVRLMIGQSTGSSMTYVNRAADAIKKWMKENPTSFEPVSNAAGEQDPLLPAKDVSDEEEEVDIQSIALEGQGKIEDRVIKLFKLLENWQDIINNCDFLFMVSHSQGTPVALHILARLIQSKEYNIGDGRAKLAFLSMAGANCGPYLGLDAKLVIRAYTQLENDIMNEMFELQKTSSSQSLKLNESMKTVVASNVKITMAGAINDQFIPVFSSLACNFHHANIFRVLYMDTNGGFINDNNNNTGNGGNNNNNANNNSNSDVPKFIKTLFKIILTMKNVGYSDHDLIRDLSERCQGTVGGDACGHGRIFEHEEIYMTAIRHGLETTNLKQDKPLIIEPSLVSNGRGTVGKNTNITTSNSVEGVHRHATGSGITRASALSLSVFSREKMRASSPVNPMAANTGHGASVVGGGGGGHASDSSSNITSVIGPTTSSSSGNNSTNLYHLPWNVRGLLHDLISIKHINSWQLLHELLQNFSEWEPSTKSWRDVKMCFEALADVELEELIL